jgi:glycosyltransferase involved in cell wall biosynthesis
MKENISEKIDVVIPVYAAETFLAECLDSFLAQTLKDFKIFAVYDISPDRSLEILKAYQGKFPPGTFEILESPKKDGLGAARDFALNTGKLHGEYVLFPDADDYVEPTYLQKLYERAVETKAGITFCGFNRFDEKTGKNISVDMIHNGGQVITDLAHYDQLIYLNISVWNKLYRLDLFSSLRFTNIKRAEDTMCYLKIMPLAGSIAFVNEVLYHYRVRSGSLANSFKPEHLEAICEGFDGVIAFYKDHEKECQTFYPFLEASAFMRVALGPTVRAVLSNKKNEKTLIKITKTWLYSRFPKWYRNPYLSFRRCLKYGHKTLNVWVVKTNYRMGLFRLFIFNYRAFTKLTHKDIKW